MLQSAPYNEDLKFVVCPECGSHAVTTYMQAVTQLNGREAHILIKNTDPTLEVDDISYHRLLYCGLGGEHISSIIEQNGIVFELDDGYYHLKTQTIASKYDRIVALFISGPIPQFNLFTKQFDPPDAPKFKGTAPKPLTQTEGQVEMQKLVDRLLRK